MEQPFPFIPWSNATLWSAAKASFEYSLRHHQDTLGASRDLAHEARTQLLTIFPLMDRLCRATCPDCVDICCRRACVWLDFKDLLFLHLADIPLPPEQLISRRGERCRYNGPAGCRLDRIQRPFVCTWYLCPCQMECLRAMPANLQAITETLQHIKQLRLDMETMFIQAQLNSAHPEMISNKILTKS